MSIVYVNGEFVEEAQAKVSVFDRGFLFGDGIYEAISVIDSKLIDALPHLARLKRSLNEVSMNSPLSDDEIIEMLRQLIAKNDFKEGLLYFQITRGVAARTFQFPDASVKSSIVAFCMPMTLVDREDTDTGVSLISIADIRWKRRDIKSISLIAQCLGKQTAVENNAYEAIMVEDGMVTEGTSSNAYIVKDKTLITRPLSRDILPGVTRRAILALAKQEDIRIEERPFSLEEAYQADELCITAASIFIMPVVALDGRKIGDGKPGEIVKRLRALYIKEALASAM